MSNPSAFTLKGGRYSNNEAKDGPAIVSANGNTSTAVSIEDAQFEQNGHDSSRMFLIDPNEALLILDQIHWWAFWMRFPLTWKTLHFPVLLPSFGVPCLISTFRHLHWTTMCLLWPLPMWPFRVIFSLAKRTRPLLAVPMLKLSLSHQAQIPFQPHFTAEETSLWVIFCLATNLIPPESSLHRKWPSLVDSLWMVRLVLTRLSLLASRLQTYTCYLLGNSIFEAMTVFGSSSLWTVYLNRNHTISIPASMSVDFQGQIFVTNDLPIPGTFPPGTYPLFVADPTATIVIGGSASAGSFASIQSINFTSAISWAYLAISGPPPPPVLSPISPPLNPIAPPLIPTAPPLSPIAPPLIPIAPPLSPIAPPNAVIQNPPHELNDTGAIVGGIVGGVLGFSLLLFLILFFVRRRKRQAKKKDPVYQMKNVAVPRLSDLSNSSSSHDSAESAEEEISASAVSVANTYSDDGTTNGSLTRSERSASEESSDDGCTSQSTSDDYYTSQSASVGYCTTSQSKSR